MKRTTSGEQNRVTSRERRSVTGDAGLCARENAALVTQLGRWYVLGLKGNQPHLYGLACEHRHYSVGKPLARTVESYRGHTIERALYARDVAGDPEADIEDARQLGYVCQATSTRAASASQPSSGTSSPRSPPLP